MHSEGVIHFLSPKHPHTKEKPPHTPKKNPKKPHKKKTQKKKKKGKESAGTIPSLAFS